MDTDQPLKYLTYVGRGLVAHHWKIVIPEQDQILRDLFVMDADGYARGDIGNGLIMYEGR